MAAKGFVSAARRPLACALKFGMSSPQAVGAGAHAHTALFLEGTKGEGHWGTAGQGGSVRSGSAAVESARCVWSTVSLGQTLPPLKGTTGKVTVTHSKP